jgi:hypothetical protein
MRITTLLAGLLAALFLGGCADGPTAPEQRAADNAGVVHDTQVTPQGCVIDGLCHLPPIVVDGGCDPWEELDWSCGGECIESAGAPTDPKWGISVQGCPPGGGGPGDGGGPGGGGTPSLPPGDDPGDPPVCPTAATESCPPAEEEEYSDICPQPIMGKVATALVNVAGRNHEFKFEGPFWRVNPLVGRSPAWYQIARPALSKDSWWMAASGKIQLVCWGRYVTVLGSRVWGGTVYVQNTDLHVVMGPGHPDF